MERKGGCCIAPRYGAAAAGGQQAWQMGRIMLKFRPIAPKPAAMAPVPTPAPVPAAAAAVAGRGKRKAVGGGGGGRRGRKPKRAATDAPVAAVASPAALAAPAVVDSKKDKDCDKEKPLSSRSSSSSGMTSVDSSPPPPTQQQRQPTTLPLMPVSPVEEKATVAAATGEPALSAVAAPDAGAPPAPPRPLRPVPAAAASWVTVEVTATWRDGDEAPSSAARVPVPCADGADAAPAFVSDQWGRVTWTNAAFARAVSADDEAVALAGALPAWGTCAGFTCRVRVVRHANHHTAPRASSVVAPCDVWRLEAVGCYLWRLDLQAALTLGGLP